MAIPGSGAAGVAWEQLVKSGRLVPDVVEALPGPEALLDMRALYKEIEVANGLGMRQAQTQIRPHVELHGPSAGTSADLYTLLMVDPDAPSPSNPAFRCFLHWLVVNIPGSTAPSQEIWETGSEEVPYMGPAPPEGEHRYIFLLYKQRGEIKPQKIEERGKFHVDSFAKANGLEKVVGGKFYVAKAHDELDYSGQQVPQLPQLQSS